MYPRHFGIIVESKAALEQLWNNIKDEDYVFEELFGRHIGKREEHWTFFLKDPSNNLVEFKWYKHEEAIFTSKSLNKP
jgi:extradiol dioxygenase family protein